MADDVTLSAGTGGDTIAADDIAGVKHQRVKVQYGDDGAATDVSATNPLPVDGTVAATQSGTWTVQPGNTANTTAWKVDGSAVTQPVSGTVTANAGSGTMTIAGAVTNAGTFAVQDSEKVADNAGFTDGTTKVQPVGYIYDEVAGTALTENDAAAARIDAKRAQVGVLEDATTRGQRAAVSAAGRLAVDASGVAVPVTDNGASLTMDYATTGSGTAAGALRVELPTNGTGVVGLNAGTNAIGKLAANSGVDIGDVDVTTVGTITPGTAATSLGKAVDAVAGATDTGIAPLAIRDDSLATLTPVDGDYTQLRTNSQGALWVDSSQITQPVSYATTGSGTATGALRVELPTNGTGVLATVGAVTAITNALPAGTNAIGKLAANSGVDIGDVDVTSIAAGTNAIGNVGIIPRTSGGLTIFRSLDLDETEEEVKASAGQIFGWYIFNAAATTHYVKLYNATAANTTVGTTTPILTIPVPAGAAANVFTEVGIAFGTALSAAATTGVADSDTGAPAANAVVVNIFYA